MHITYNLIFTSSQTRSFIKEKGSRGLSPICCSSCEKSLLAITSFTSSHTLLLMKERCSGWLLPICLSPIYLQPYPVLYEREMFRMVIAYMHITYNLVFTFSQTRSFIKDKGSGGLLPICCSSCVKSLPAITSYLPPARHGRL